MVLIPSRQSRFKSEISDTRNELGIWLADITVLGLGGKSSNDRQRMLICRMVTPLSLLKFRLAQVCPETSRNEISTGGSVQFQGKRCPVDVDRHAFPLMWKLLDLRAATRRRFDHFQDIDPLDALSFRTRFLLDTQPPSVRLICRNCTWHLLTCTKLIYGLNCHNGSIVAVQLTLPSWEGAEALAVVETVSAQSPTPERILGRRPSPSQLWRRLPFGWQPG